MEYEKCKCVGCKRVFTTFIVFSSPEYQDSKRFVMCQDCAKEVHASMSSMMEKKTRAR